MPEKLLSVAGDFDAENYSDSDDDCVLLEDTVKEFPKPINFREMAGKSEPGTSLETNMDSKEQDIEIAEPIATVTESCSEIPKNGSMEEAGPSIVEAIQEELIPGSIELDTWKNLLRVCGQDLLEKQSRLKSPEIFFNDQSAQEPPESKDREDLEATENSADPRSQDFEQTEAAGSNSSGECSAESGNEPMEISATSAPRIIDCLPGPSKPSSAGKEIKETHILTSQNQKKGPGTQTNGSSSDGAQKRKSLARKCKKINYSEITDASESESEELPDPPLNEKLKKNPETRENLKNQKSASETKKLTEKMKYWKCDNCGKRIGSRRHLTRHFQTHNTTKDFNCRICGKGFKTQDCRYHHEQRHNASKVSCEICGKECPNRFALDSHLRFVHSDQKTKCQICNKILSCKRSLREHEKRIHKLN